MATSVSSHQIVLPDSRQIVLVKARPGERVDDLVINPSPKQQRMIQCCDDILSVFDDGGPAYTTLLMELKMDQGSVPTLIPSDGSHVLDHETCVKLARYITLPVGANVFSEEDEKEVCVICLDEIKLGEMMVELACEHRYHEKCIENWLRLKQRFPDDCPTCRALG